MLRDKAARFIPTAIEGDFFSYCSVRWVFDHASALKPPRWMKEIRLFTSLHVMSCTHQMFFVLFLIDSIPCPRALFFPTILWEFQ